MRATVVRGVSTSASPFSVYYLFIQSGGRWAFIKNKTKRQTWVFPGVFNSYKRPSGLL